MRTYADLTTSQLTKLAEILLGDERLTGPLQIQRDLPESDCHILVFDGIAREIMFNLKTGLPRYYRDGQPAHLLNLFQFVDTCRQFGLPY